MQIRPIFIYRAELTLKETWLCPRVKEPTEEAFKEAGSIAKTECSPIEDMRGTADQRRHLVDVLTARTLGKALERIGG